MINYTSQGISDFSLQLILNNSDEPFILLDRNLEVVTFNAAAQSAFDLVYKKKLQAQKHIFSILENEDAKKLSLVLANVMRGHAEELQYRVTLEDASFKILFICLKPLYKDGEIIGATLTSKDVTSQYVIEEELRRSNDQFRRASLASYDIIWEHDLLTQTLHFSENFSSSFGYEHPIRVLSLIDFEKQFIHPEDRTVVALAVSNFLASRQLHFTFPVHRLLKKDGTAVYVEANAIVSRGRDGKPYRLTGVTRDITDRYLMEQRLKESNKRYELAARASFDLIFEANLQTGKIIHNDIITSLYGYEPGELATVDDLKRFVHPDDLVLVEHETKKLEATAQEQFHIPLFRLLKKNGEVVYTEIKALVIRDHHGKLLKRIGTARDITYRYLMEQEVRKSHERYELATNASSDLIWDRDFVTNRCYYNQTFVSFYGYSPEELHHPEEVFARFFHPDDRKWLLELVTNFLNGDQCRLVYPVHRLLKADGTVVYVEATALLIRDENGKPLRMIGVTKDITERYLMEQKLRESNDRFTRAAKASFDIIWEADLRTKKVFFNEVLTATLGYQENEFETVNEFFDQLLHPDDKDTVAKVIHDFLKSDRSFITYPVYRVRKKDGSFIYVEANALATRDENGKVCLLTGVVHDITHRYIMEQALRDLNTQLKVRAAQLEASNKELERFAYVASHDLQEPLRMVSSFMELFEKKYNGMLDATGRQYIHFAVDGANRMKRLILDLLQFSRIGTSSEKMELTDFNDIVQQLLLEFTFTIEEKKARITVEPLPQLVVNKSQMEQVFRNLISNALKYNASAQPAINIGCIEEAEEYKFFVKDNGIGIKEQFFNKIFIIFQQLHTKNEYSGTGIGLAITKKIVEQHRGRIWVESTPGLGSTFYFTIPKETNN